MEATSRIKGVFLFFFFFFQQKATEAVQRGPRAAGDCCGLFFSEMIR